MEGRDREAVKACARVHRHEDVTFASRAKPGCLWSTNRRPGGNFEQKSFAERLEKSLCSGVRRQGRVAECARRERQLLPRGARPDKLARSDQFVARVVDAWARRTEPGGRPSVEEHTHRDRP